MISVIMTETEKMSKFPFPELTVPFLLARCGELLSSKYLCCQTPFCLQISLYRHFVNQLKPQALENTDERTLKTSMIIYDYSLKHTRMKLHFQPKLTVFHRSHKLMTL